MYARSFDTAFSLLHYDLFLRIFRIYSRFLLISHDDISIFASVRRVTEVLKWVLKNCETFVADFFNKSEGGEIFLFLLKENSLPVCLKKTAAAMF